MIHLSPAATTEIRRLQSKQQLDVFFRLTIQPGGCSGWIYEMSFDQNVEASDRIFDLNDIRLVIDAKSLDYVKGLTVDYAEDLMGGGFRFHNPQSISTCDCGNSFSIIQ